MVWTTIEDHLGQRPSLYIPLRARASQQDQRQTKPVDCIPPSNRWALRAEEPVGRAISTPRRERTARGLESMAHSGISSTQRPRQFHDGRNPYRSPVGLSTHPSSRSERGDEQSDGGTTSRDPASETRPGDRGDQQGGKPRPNSGGKVQGGRPSLVRGVESKTTLPHPKVGPQTSRTLPYQRGNIAGGLSARPPLVMGHP